MPEETAPSPAILAAVNAVMDEVRSISKSGRMEVRGGPNYNFRKADDVVNELGEAFRRFSIMPQSQVLKLETESYETIKRDEKWGDKITRWHRSIVTMRYTFTSLVDGSTLVAEGVGEGLDSGDKSVPKAMTGAMKSAFTQAYAIAFKDMADPDSERPEYQDETETEAQRLLRERREAQAAPAKASEPQPTGIRAEHDRRKQAAADESSGYNPDMGTQELATMSTGTNGVTEQVQQAKAEQQAQMKADAEQGSGDPLANGVQTLKTELGAREIGQAEDTPEWRERHANEVLSAASKEVARRAAAGEGWPEMSDAQRVTVGKAAQAAQAAKNRDQINKIIIHAAKLGLLIMLHQDNALGAALYVARRAQYPTDAEQAEDKAKATVGS